MYSVNKYLLSTPIYLRHYTKCPGNFSEYGSAKRQRLTRDINAFKEQNNGKTGFALVLICFSYTRLEDKIYKD